MTALLPTRFMAWLLLPKKTKNRFILSNLFWMGMFCIVLISVSISSSCTTNVDTSITPAEFFNTTTANTYTTHTDTQTLSTISTGQDTCRGIDLALEKIQVPNELIPGLETFIIMDIANRGVVDLEDGTTLDIYGLYGSYTESDSILLETLTIESLKAGETRTVTTIFTIPLDITEDYMRIFGFIDPPENAVEWWQDFSDNQIINAGSIEECDEFNNGQQDMILNSTDQYVAKPNLRAYSMLAHQNYELGKTYSVLGLIENTSVVPVTDVTVSVYLADSGDVSQLDGDDPVIGSITIPYIPENSIIDEDIVLEIPDTVTPANKQLLLYVDPSDELLEKDESDNAKVIMPVSTQGDPGDATGCWPLTTHRWRTAYLEQGDIDCFDGLANNTNYRLWAFSFETVVVDFMRGGSALEDDLTGIEKLYWNNHNLIGPPANNLMKWKDEGSSDLPAVIWFMLTEFTPDEIEIDIGPNKNNSISKAQNLPLLKKENNMAISVSGGISAEDQFPGDYYMFPTEGIHNLFVYLEESGMPPHHATPAVVLLEKDNLILLEPTLDEQDDDGTLFTWQFYTNLNSSGYYVVIKDVQDKHQFETYNYTMHIVAY